MTQMVLKISAKSMDPKVNYIGVNKVINEKSDFLAPSSKKEVKTEKKVNWKTVGKIALTTSTLALAVVHPALAATTDVIVPSGADGIQITPEDIRKIFATVSGLFALASTGFAIFLYQVSGTYRMLRRENKGKATEWQQEIMKGYTQVVTAPVIIMAIAILATLLFGGFAWFVKPF